MFPKHAFLDRFAMARAAGFWAVECQFPYEHGAEEIAERLRANNQRMVMFNTPQGDTARGDLGFAAVAGQEASMRWSVERGIAYCQSTGARLLHLLAGLASTDARGRTAFEAALSWAAPRAAGHGITLLIEPLAPAAAPGYFLNSFELAADIIRGLALPNLKLQFDIYHRQLMRGDVVAGLRELLPIIGHIQIASVPGRHEPCSGELNDRFILQELETLGYRGAVGLEYRPAGSTSDGLAWMTDLMTDRGDAIDWDFDKDV